MKNLINPTLLENENSSLESEEQPRNTCSGGGCNRRKCKGDAGNTSIETENDILF